jgi:Leucine-rich repeat (LRR) protein
LVWLEELKLGGDISYSEELGFVQVLGQTKRGPENTFSRLPKDFSNLQQLKILIIGGDYNHILPIGHISEIASLGNLQALYMSQTAVRNITPLEGLSHLQELHLHQNKINDVSVLANLKNLKDLSFTLNQVKDLTPLAKLSNLQNGLATK